MNILIIGVGGLGKCMVEEALARDLNVSVLVRRQAKLEHDLGNDNLSRLHKIHIGDASDVQTLDRAMQDINVVLSGVGARPELAEALAEAVKRNNLRKLCWPAGTTNVLADDGITPNYKNLLHLGNWVKQAYRVHGMCIDFIQKADINYVIFCPGRMTGVGHRSPNVQETIRINRDAGSFVSYEDAAWVMLEAATTDTYDRKLISAATSIQ